MTFALPKAGRLLAAAVTATLAIAALALPPGTEEEIFERIHPIGTVKSAEPVELVDTGPVAPRAGEEIYNSYCTACHASGVAGAPLFGDSAAWAPRIAKGMNVLYENTYNGLNGVMPPRGTCPDCSDEELDATVDFMVSAAQ